MQRREFLIKAGLVGAAAPALARAAVPCPAPKVSGAGSASVMTACPQPGTAPTWFLNMPDQTWTAIAGGAGYGAAYQNGARAADVGPSGGTPAAIVSAWNGAMVDQSLGEFQMAAQGGHSDYGGNEVYVCQITAAVPGWVRLCDPTPTSAQGPTVTTKNTDFPYADGRVRAGHTYNNQVAANGIIWKPCVPAQYDSTEDTSCIYYFNRASLNGQTLPVPYTSSPWIDTHVLGMASWSGGNIGSGPVEGGSAVYDRFTGNIWQMLVAGVNGSGQGVYSFTTTNLSSVTATQWPFGLGSGSGVRWGALAYGLRNATDSGVWIVFDNGSGGRLLLADLQNPSSNPHGALTVATMSGSFPAFTYGGGAVYHAASRAVLVWDNSGANIVKVAVPVTAPLTGTYAISTVTPSASNAVTPSAANSNGTYGRFNIIEDMGNGQSALVVYNDITQPIYVYKLPVAGI